MRFTPHDALACCSPSFNLSFVCLPECSFPDGRSGQPVVQPRRRARHDGRSHAPAHETGDEAPPGDLPEKTGHVDVNEDRGDVDHSRLWHENAEGRAERVGQGCDTARCQGGGSNVEFHNGPHLGLVASLMMLGPAQTFDVVPDSCLMALVTLFDFGTRLTGYLGHHLKTHRHIMARRRLVTLGAVFGGQ